MQAQFVGSAASAANTCREPQCVQYCSHMCSVWGVPQQCGRHARAGKRESGHMRCTSSRIDGRETALTDRQAERTCSYAMRPREKKKNRSFVACGHVSATLPPSRAFSTFFSSRRSPYQRRLAVLEMTCMMSRGLVDDVFYLRSWRQRV